MYQEAGTRTARSPEPVSHWEYLKELGVFSWRRTLKRDSKNPALDKLKPLLTEGMSFLCAAELGAVGKSCRKLVFSFVEGRSHLDQIRCLLGQAGADR